MATSKIQSDFTFPLISEMTAPSITNNNRISDIVGGFKQIGKTVYVDMSAKFGIQMDMTNKTFPEPSMWQMAFNFPVPKHDLTLPCIIYKNDKTAKYYAISWLINTAQQYKGALYIGSNNLTVNNTFSFTIRGTYQAE